MENGKGTGKPFPTERIPPRSCLSEGGSTLGEGVHRQAGRETNRQGHGCNKSHRGRVKQCQGYWLQSRGNMWQGSAVVSFVSVRRRRHAGGGVCSPADRQTDRQRDKEATGDQGHGCIVLRRSSRRTYMSRR